MLAACGGGSSSGDPISVTSGPVLGIGIDGASAGLPPTKEDSIVLVHDGTVKGAAVYFDTDGDGMVSEEEKEAQRDDEGNRRSMSLMKRGRSPCLNNFKIGFLLLM